MVEYDRRLRPRSGCSASIIPTCLDHALAVGARAGGPSHAQTSAASAGRGAEGASAGDGKIATGDFAGRPGAAILPCTARAPRPRTARALIDFFRAQFRDEPLLYTPLHQGGQPRQILRASIAQTILRGLVVNLPRRGCSRETYQLLRLARAMEAGQTLPGPRVTEFDRLFQLGFRRVVEAVLEAAQRKDIDPGAASSPGWNVVVEPFLALWVEHSRDAARLRPRGRAERRRSSSGSSSSSAATAATCSTPAS